MRRRLGRADRRNAGGAPSGWQGWSAGLGVAALLGTLCCRAVAPSGSAPVQAEAELAAPAAEAAAAVSPPGSLPREAFEAGPHNAELPRLFFESHHSGCFHSEDSAHV